MLAIFNTTNVLVGTYWDEDVGDLLLVALPGLAILPPASVDIPVSAVNDHDHEENEVEPREGAPVDIRLVIIASMLRYLEILT